MLPRTFMYLLYTRYTQPLLFFKGGWIGDGMGIHLSSLITWWSWYRNRNKKAQREYPTRYVTTFNIFCAIWLSCFQCRRLAFRGNTRCEDARIKKYSRTWILLKKMCVVCVVLWQYAKKTWLGIAMQSYIDHKAWRPSEGGGCNSIIAKNKWF